jgi:exportin-T
MQKMKWDDEEDPSDLDDDDFSAFETLRKVASMPLTAFSPLTFFVGS